MSQEFIPKYTPEYFDDCLAKVHKLDKLLEPYDNITQYLQEMNVIIEAYRCCGTEIDFMPDMIEKVYKIWDIVDNAKSSIWTKRDPFLDELMNE